jgi:hypothetical protein
MSEEMVSAAVFVFSLAGAAGLVMLLWEMFR